MAETTLQLGFVPKNRGEYQSTPVTRYYKDNVVQYNGSSYIADPVGWSEDHPTDTYVTIAPTDASGNLNAGWRVFASGNNTFTTGEKVDNVGIDDEPTAGSKNLVKSGGVAIIKEHLPISLSNKISFPYYGYYKVSDGTFIGNTTAAKSSDFIEVEEGWKIVVNISPDDSVLFTIIAFDSSLNIVMGSCVSGNKVDYTYTVPSGVKYLRFTTRSGSTYLEAADVVFTNSLKVDTDYVILQFDTNAYTTRNSIPQYKRKQGLIISYNDGERLVTEKRIHSLNSDWGLAYCWEEITGSSDISILKSTLGVDGTEILVNNWILGRIDKTDGHIYNSVVFRTSNFIPVVAGEKLFIIAMCDNGTNEPCIANYNSQKEFVSIQGRKEANNTYIGYYTIPTGVSYIRINKNLYYENTYNFGAWRNISSFGIKRVFGGINVVNGKFLDNAALVYIKTNFTVTGFKIVGATNNPTTVGVSIIYNEATHPDSTWRRDITESQSSVFKGFKEFTWNYGPSTIKIGIYFFGEVDYPITGNEPFVIPVSNIQQDDIDPTNELWKINNSIGEILSSENELKIRWKQGRLNMSGSTYTGWTYSTSYWNSGYIKLPAGDYKLIGRSTTSEAPLIIKFNNDYTFNSVLVSGSTSVATYNFTLQSDTIIACNTQQSTYEDFSLVRLNSGELDLCKDFSDVLGKLYYKGQPIASETSISTLVTDLPVSDGTGIEDGYAYIDSITYVIKVKHS